MVDVVIVVYKLLLVDSVEVGEMLGVWERPNIGHDRSSKYCFVHRGGLMLTRHRNNTVDSAAFVSWFGVVTTKSDKCECECDARKPRTTILVGPNASKSALPRSNWLYRVLKCRRSRMSLTRGGLLVELSAWSGTSVRSVIISGCMM